MQLQPGETFYFARQLDNSADPSVYYIRAVIRNNRTDSTLATVDMTDKGNQRFVGYFTVPMDAVGNGYYISITTSVYTDSGYSSLSPVYSTIIENHLIQERFSRAFGYGGDSVVSSKQLREAIDEGLAKLPKTKETKIEFPEVKFPDIPNYERDFNEIKRDLAEIREFKKELGVLSTKMGVMERTKEELVKQANEMNREALEGVKDLLVEFTKGNESLFKKRALDLMAGLEKAKKEQMQSFRDTLDAIYSGYKERLGDVTMKMALEDTVRGMEKKPKKEEPPLLKFLKLR